MRKPIASKPTARKRVKPAAHDIAWKVVMPTLPPIPTAEEIATVQAAEAARKLSARRPPRVPQQCTVSYTGGADGQIVPLLRLRGRWLEQAGFTIGRKLRLSVGEGALGMSVAEDPPAPEEPMDPELQRLLVKTILALPPRCRLALGLFSSDRLSSSQISEMMGIPVKQVERYIARGLRACRAAVGDRDY